MRIMLVTSKLNFKTAGGSVWDLHLKAKYLQELGHDVTVVTVFSHANAIAEPLSYTVIEENASAPRWLVQLKKIYFILKKYQSQTDVFYIDGNSFVYAGGAYRLFGGIVPVLGFFNVKLSCWPGTQGNDPATQNTVVRFKARLRFWLERILGTWMANHLDAFVFTTPMVKDLYVAFGYDSKKSTIIPDFINTQEIITAENLTLEKIKHHQLAPNPVVILCSGRMIPEKGFDQVIRALALVKNQDRIQIIMSGGGPELDNLKALAKELQVDTKIIFPGWVSRDELISFFNQAHIFILPKWWIEYTSVLLIEAMSHGLPSIVPRGGGLEWLANESSCVFTIDNVSELAVCMERLVLNAQDRIALSEKALHISHDLDARILAKKLELLLTQLSF